MEQEAVTSTTKKWLISALRRLSYRTKARTAVKSKARVARGKYECAHCSKVFPPKSIQVDHIQPIVPTSGWDDWDGFLDRLFCDESGLQVLCLSCHTLKTNSENALRK